MNEGKHKTGNMHLILCQINWFRHLLKNVSWIVKKCVALGTIQVLRHHVFDFLGPPTHLFDDLQYCKSSKIAIF